MFANCWRQTIGPKNSHLPPFSAKQEIVPSAYVPSETFVHENHFVMSNGDAGLSSDKIEKIVAHAEFVDTYKSQPTVFNGDDKACQVKGVAVNDTVDSEEKQPISEDDIYVLNEERSKLGVSDGHVVFPEHLQVPEAYKKKSPFGSFGDSLPFDGKPTTDGDAVSTDVPMPADDSHIVKTVAESSIENGGIISSTVKDAQERENSGYLQSSFPMSKITPHLFEHLLSDVVIKIDEPETENILHNGGPDLGYRPSNHAIGYASKPQLQAHDNTELQDGNLITSSAWGVDQNGNIRPSGVTHDTVPSPPPGPYLRQTYHPNLFPYGRYYPQFFLPQGQQQYLTHGGFP